MAINETALHKNIIADTAKLLKDVKACRGSEIDPTSIQFINSEMYQNICIEGSVSCHLPEFSVIIDDVPCDFHINDITYDCETRIYNSIGNVDEVSVPLDYDCNVLQYSQADLDLDFPFLEETTQREYSKCLPPLTLNRKIKIKAPLAQKVLPWGRKKKKYFSQKKLPDRKCASSYINKSNRIEERETEEKICEVNQNEKEDSKENCGWKRGRPAMSRRMSNGSNINDNAKEKRYGTSVRNCKVIQDLEVDLEMLKIRFDRSIDTREEAFQMLSDVQRITKTLQIHIENATRFNKSRPMQKNQRKLLLNYLGKQILKSEELEILLDDAISEADRLAGFGFGEEADAGRFT